MQERPIHRKVRAMMTVMTVCLLLVLEISSVFVASGDTQRLLPNVRDEMGMTTGCTWELECPLPPPVKTMRVYKIKTGPADEAAVAHLGKQYLEEPGSVTHWSSDWWSVKGKGFELQVAKDDVSFFTLESKHFYKSIQERIALKREDLPSDDECRAIAEDFIRKKKLSPQDSDYTVRSVVDNRSGSGTISVFCARLIDGYDAGGAIDIDIDANGEVVAARVDWPAIEAEEAYELRPAGEALEALRNGAGIIRGGKEGKITKSELKYYREGDYYLPCYRFRGNGQNSEEVLQGFVDAVKPEFREPERKVPTKKTDNATE